MKNMNGLGPSQPTEKEMKSTKGVHLFSSTCKVKGLSLVLFVLIFLVHTGIGHANLAGSTVMIGAPRPVASDTFDLVFTMTLVSIDGEYVDKLETILPSGWTVNHVLAPPQNTLDTCGVVGVMTSTEDRTVVWEIAGGYTGGSTCGPWGLVGSHGPDFHFIANVTVPHCSGAPWTLPWKIYGDSYGGDPHDITGALTIDSCINPTTASSASYSFTTFTHPDAIATRPTSINDNGQIVGYYQETGLNRRGFLYDGGTFISINYPGADETKPYGINNNGYIVGTYQDGGGNSHGFVYNGSDYSSIDHPAPGVTGTKIYDINDNSDNNHITGSFSDGSGVHGFYYDGTIVKELAYPGMYFTFPRGINNGHEITGSYVGSLGRLQGFFYNGANFSYVSYPGIHGAEPSDINDKGTIVGAYLDSEWKYHGFLFDGVSHYSQVDYPGAEETLVSSLNEKGELVGFYLDTSGRVHGFMARKFPWPLFLPAILGKE